jgi:hypothetical protein
MTDLVARYWQGDVKGDASAYCHIGLPDLSLDNQRLLLLHLATTSPTWVREWQYFGKHAMPLVLHSWVRSANYWTKHKHAGSQKDIVITNMQMHIPALGESCQTEARFACMFCYLLCAACYVSHTAHANRLRICLQACCAACLSLMKGVWHGSLANLRLKAASGMSAL